MTQKSKSKSGSEKSRTDNFESTLKRLEEIVETLEQGTVSLDDAMKMYEEGVTLSKQCLEKLSQTEVKLKRLAKDVNENFELFDEGLEE